MYKKLNVSIGFTPEEVVYHTALLEQTSTHPLAHAILDEAKRRNLSLSQPNADAKIKEVTGKGVYGVKNGRNIRVGSLSFLQDQGIQTKELIRTEQFSVYVAIDGKLAGAFLIQDTVRPGMKNTIKRLRLQGVKKVIMLTGDMQDSANRIAQQVQVDEFHARMLPEEKLHYIEEAKKSRKVAMVGDGMNDAPALTKADIGITFGGKRTDLAVEASDVVISHDNPYVLTELMDLSKETMKTVKQNVLATFAINGSAILLGAFGLISTVTGAAIHNLATIGVVLNSIKILVKGEKHRATVYGSPRYTWKTADSNTFAA